MKRIILTVNYEHKDINPRLHQNTRDSMLHACTRWDCEFVELSHETLPLTVSPAAAKTQLFTDITGDEILVLDADVVIWENAPNPFETLPKDCMNVVRNVILPRRRPEYNQIKSIEKDEWEKFQEKFGPVTYIPDNYFNSGVMLVRKNLHAEVFKLALEMHKWCLANQVPMGWVDQTPFNFATAKLGIKMNYIDESWNYVWANNLPNYINMQKNIYHFAGDPLRNDRIPLINWRTT